MNLATPRKFNQKRHGRSSTPLKGRVIQGEKGIGRFAVLKLGNTVVVTTKTKESTFESVLSYDFTKFDNDFTIENSEPKEIFLDEIEIDYSESSPPKVINTPCGTTIDIQNLKGIWNQKIIDDLCQDVSTLTDPISRISEHTVDDSFKITVTVNGESKPVEDKSTEDLKAVDRK